MEGRFLRVAKKAVPENMEKHSMPVDESEKNALRELGRRVAEIAALPVQQEKIGLWKALNGLNPVRPMVTIDQVCWNEMEVDDELTVQSENEFCRRIETILRQTLYRWEHMPVDMVVLPAMRLPRAIRCGDFGIRTNEEVAVTDPTNSVVGHSYTDQIETEEDIEKIKDPEVTEDVEVTARMEAAALEIFDGILDVEMVGVSTMFSPWDQIVSWRSPEKTLLDLAMRPDFMHKIIDRTAAAHMRAVDQLEEQGLLESEQPIIHCTGAFTDELPGKGHDPASPRTRDVWTAGQAQIFSDVSPSMHQEFDLDYAEKWYSRFGLGYYGCCEPLHKKVDIIKKKIPNLRKLSMSPWTDQDEGAEQMGPDVVFSRKPNPAFLAVDTWSTERVRDDLSGTIDCCRRHGCPLELIMKDISTVRYEPHRLWEWADIAMELVEGA